MDQKQTSPQGNPAGGQEGQTMQPGSASGNVSGAKAPVFSSPSPDTNPAASPSAGTLGSDTLSTGANVSRTMDSLNSNKQSATGKSVFSKHKFDKVAPVSGDILLPGTEDNKKSGGLFGGRGGVSGEVVDPVTGKPLTRSRRMRAIGITSAAFAVVLIVVIVGVLIFAPRKSKTVEKGVATTVQSEFNKYANWVLYGTSSTDDIDTSRDSETEYEFVRVAAEGQDELYDFIRTAEGQFNSFSKKFTESNLHSYDALASLVAETSAELGFYAAYAENAMITDEEILEKYISDGSKAKSELDNVYDGILELGATAENYAAYAKERIELLIKQYSALQNANCIKNNKIDAACKQELFRSNDNLADEDGAIFDLKYKMLNIIYTTEKRIVGNTFDISAELASPTENAEAQDDGKEEFPDGYTPGGSNNISNAEEQSSNQSGQNSNVSDQPNDDSDRPNTENNTQESSVNEEGAANENV